FFIDVDDDLIVIGGRSRLPGRRLTARDRASVHTPAEVRLRDRDERVSLLRAPAVRRTLGVGRELDAERDFSSGHRALDRAADELALLGRQLDGDPHAAAGPI